MTKEETKKITNFEWNYYGQQYQINWPAVVVISGGFFIAYIVQHFFY